MCPRRRVAGTRIQDYPLLQNVIPAEAGIQAKEKCHSRENGNLDVSG